MPSKPSAGGRKPRDPNTLYNRGIHHRNAAEAHCAREERRSAHGRKRAEAEAFATRIQELLAKYKLSRTEVEDENLDKDDPIGHSRIDSKKVDNEKWYLILADGVATNFYCRTIEERSKRQKGFLRDKAAVVFVGRDSDREAATSMFSYLAHLGAELAAQQVDRLDSSETFTHFRREMKSHNQPDKSTEKTLRNLLKKCRADFLLGFASALNLRLAKNRKQLETGASESAAALIRKDEIAIADAVQALCGSDTARKLGLRGPKFKNFFAAGYSAGSAVGLDARASLDSGD